MARPTQGVIFGKPDRFGSRKITTEAALAMERRVVEAARSRVGIYRPLLQPKDRQAFLDKTPERHRKGMAKLISSRDGVVILTAEEDVRETAAEIAQKAGAVDVYKRQREHLASELSNLHWSRRSAFCGDKAPKSSVSGYDARFCGF